MVDLFVGLRTAAQESFDLAMAQKQQERFQAAFDRHRARERAETEAEINERSAVIREMLKEEKLGAPDQAPDKDGSVAWIGTTFEMCSGDDKSINCINTLGEVMAYFGYGDYEDWADGEKAVVMWFMGRYAPDGLEGFAADE